METDKEHARSRAQQGLCDGNCEQHVGQVKVVRVHGWGYFAYCDTAIEEDTRRGLTLNIEVDK